MNPLVLLISTLIHLYIYALIAWVVLSMLIAFSIVNRYQPFVQRLNVALFRLTDPALRPIRKRLPYLEGFDIAPILLIVLLETLDYSLYYYLGGLRF